MKFYTKLNEVLRQSPIYGTLFFVCLYHTRVSYKRKKSMEAFIKGEGVRMACNCRRSRNNENPELSCVLTILLAVVAMPLVGLYLMCVGKSGGTKVIGFLMLVLGIIFWVSIA